MNGAKRLTQQARNSATQRSSSLGRLLACLWLFAIGLCVSLGGCRSSNPASNGDPAAATPTASPHAAASDAAPTQTGGSADDKIPATRGSTGTAAAPKAAENDEALEQLDFASEAAARQGGYAVWVHVANNGKPVPKAIVGALDADNKIVSKAYADAKGDTVLSLVPGNYRLVAKRHGLVADESIVANRGSQVTVELKAGTIAAIQ